MAEPIVSNGGGTGTVVAQNTNTAQEQAPSKPQVLVSVQQQQQQQVHKHDKQKVSCVGNFPAVGSLLGDYFCLGKLGKGTFCSIHKCAALNYWANTSDKKARIVAAKVELSNFANSGVLDGEAQMLSHLDSSLPPGAVPLYLGHLYSEKHSAILMEYLGGDDMHQLRESLGTRRITVEDAVFLTAEVFIPLLEKMHDAGVVHRDVKPSNCVRRQKKEFLLVDFGLSKTVLVPKDHALANAPFNQTHSLRKEREKADFRGTSMYASLRVHQLKDYGFRDDMWSVLYVFCDLVSGGLPWMSYAANRDRETCHKMKQQIFDTKDTAILLYGEHYHLKKFKREKMTQEGKTELPPMPEPLQISQDPARVKLLGKAFEHLGSLNFADRPDYALLKRCLLDFNIPPSHDENVPNMVFKDVSQRFSPQHAMESNGWISTAPEWGLFDHHDPLEQYEIWKEAEDQTMQADEDQGNCANPVSEYCNLSVQFQFRIAQMNYNSKNVAHIPHHLALKDFMKVALPLLHCDWDTPKFEGAPHRTSTDGYRRELYLKLLDLCLLCADKFGCFASAKCWYEICEKTNKRRKNLWTGDHGELVGVAKVIVGLHATKRMELGKRSSPPAGILFS